MSKDVTFTAGLSDEETPEKKKKWHREEGTSAREGIHKGKINHLFFIFLIDLKNVFREMIVIMY